MLTLAVLNSLDKGYATIGGIRTEINKLVTSRYGHKTMWRVIHTMADQGLLEKFHFGSNRPRAMNIIYYRLTAAGNTALEESKLVIGEIFGLAA